ncbi:hypothetical protein BU14_1788s0001 [Porphyra umbilicalis]|uniref:O-fucosyltransferase family protein n=1 Tax=Porphyra umbilicalis TaxID=2786 RepID=A0A1X6NKK5_PORUM|nr:hypothetical protein BU14_1788s0001 [Porphyra umbilicalis]|eukprot:OSX69159.1 hypothetical protein BU14_1788s0001 [Porphyra umbilicalis]
MWVQAVRLRSRLSGPTALDDLVLTYALPSRLAEALPATACAALLYQLTLMDVLRAHRAGSATVEPSRLLILHLQNGLGNRLRVLASGLAMARASFRVPLVVWERDAHMGAHFGQLFEEGHPTTGGVDSLFSSLVVVNRFPAWCDVATAAAESPDAITAYNHMDKDLGGSHSQRPDVAANSEVYRRRHIYVKSAYLLSASPPLPIAAVNAEARMLKPVAAVRQLMVKSAPAGLPKMVGVHVRSRRLARDSAAVDASCEYSVASAAITDQWRNASQAPAFAAEMAALVAAGPSTHFFVAVDDAALAAALADQFPGRTHGLTRACDDRGPTCMQYALVDMMCLARTRLLLGSNWSSFTEMASRLAPSPRQVVRLSGVHFGRRRLFWKDRLAALAGDVWRLVGRRLARPPTAAMYTGCRQRLETAGIAAA